MTINQLDSLTEDELIMALFIVNHLFPVPLVGELPPQGLTWFKKGVLEEKIKAAFPHVHMGAHPIFSSLLTKLGVQHEIRYESPPPPPQQPSQSTSGSQ